MYGVIHCSIDFGLLHTVLMRVITVSVTAWRSWQWRLVGNEIRLGGGVPVTDRLRASTLTALRELIAYTCFTIDLVHAYQYALIADPLVDSASHTLVSGRVVIGWRVEINASLL